MRTLLIYLSKANWMRQFVMKWKIARRVALRFVAGESLKEAIEASKRLNNQGINVTLDQLGEDTNSPGEADETVNSIILILEEIKQQGINANLSIKLSQIGLNLDYDVCAKNLEKILKRAKDLGLFVRIDMEDATTVDSTLSLFRLLYMDKGYENFGLVLQSYLYRAMDDLEFLDSLGARIRVVKGAYKESPEVAYPNKVDVDIKFDEMSNLLIRSAKTKNYPSIDTNGIWPPIPAIATHDLKRIDYAKKLVEELDLEKDKIEFQMLYGIRRDLQLDLAKEGYPVRVYVPFGTEWYPYFMRRLAERPANLFFFLSSLIKG